MKQSTKPSLTPDELDPANWVTLFGNDLLRLALFQTKDRSLAEELVQETFISGIKALKNFEGRSSVKTWLNTILRNKIIDHIRHAKKHETVSLNDEKFEEREMFFNRIGIWKKFVSSWGSNPEQLFQGQEFSKVLQTCLDKLPKRNRELFLLRTVQGFEAEEICKELDVSASNFWVIMHRARMLLRECLDKNWVSKDRV